MYVSGCLVTAVSKYERGLWNIHIGLQTIREVDKHERLVLLPAPMTSCPLQKTLNHHMHILTQWLVHIQVICHFCWEYYVQVDKDKVTA